MRLNKILSWILRLFLFTLMLIVFYILTLAYPQPLFAHKLKYNNFTVYSDKEIPNNFTDILKDVENRINILEISDTTFSPSVFLCNNNKLYEFFAFLTQVPNKSQGFNLSLLNNTFLNKSRIEDIKFYRDRRLGYTHLNGNIAQVLAHELVHNLEERHFGFLNYINKPTWKKEGYCEYGSTIALIRKDSTENLLKRASHYFAHNLYGAPNHSKIYYRSQLMVEYLFEKKNFTINMLSDPEIKEQIIFDELKKWYSSNCTK